MITCFKNIFSYTPKEQYHFSIPETNEEIDVINPGKQGQQVKIGLPIKCEKDWILRRKKDII